jgi:transcriptional regulator with XRE-family HTH domain
MAIPFIDDMKDPEFRKLLAQEELILEVTETICDILEKEKISRKGLADRLGKSKGFISQLLNGGRNLTLRTVADILHVLGYKVSIMPFKEGQEEQCDIPGSQHWHTRLGLRWELNPFPDNYLDDYSDDAAISK